MLFFVKIALPVMPVFLYSLYIKVTCKYILVTFHFFLIFVIVILLLLFRKDSIQFNSVVKSILCSTPIICILVLMNERCGMTVTNNFYFYIYYFLS